MQAKLRMVKDELWRRMHQPIPVQGKWLGQVVSGYFNYHAVPTNYRVLAMFRDEITKRWQRVLNRRSQRGALSWETLKRLADEWLPKATILHPWPHQRFAVKHPR
jgi:RNA-directed DNA polymerase